MTGGEETELCQSAISDNLSVVYDGAPWSLILFPGNVYRLSLVSEPHPRRREVTCYKWWHYHKLHLPFFTTTPSKVDQYASSRWNLTMPLHLGEPDNHGWRQKTYGDALQVHKHSLL